MFGAAETTIAKMRDAARAMRSVTTSPTAKAVVIQRAIDALTAEQAQNLAEIDETKAHEAEGASSIVTWARRELHQDAATTRQMVRAGRTFRDLPAVAEAARAGAISFEHVTSFTYALKHLGVAETQLIEEPLLEVAQHVAPSEFHAKVRQVRDMTHPDDLDAAWLKGMDKRDIRLARTTEGWHLTGFLDIETGAKLNAILTNLSVPRDAQDDRAPSTRRMDALDRICTAVVEHGLPADNGVRPHINVTVDAETLQAMAEKQAQRSMNLDSRASDSGRVWADRPRPSGPPALRRRADTVPDHAVHEELRSVGCRTDPTPRHPTPSQSHRTETARHLRVTGLPSPHRPQPPHRALVQRRTHRPRQPHRLVSQVPQPRPRRTTPARPRFTRGPGGVKMGA